MRILAVVSVLVLAGSPLSAAAEEAEAQATFQALELQVLDAIRANDVEALESFLSADFAWSIAFQGRPPHVMNRSEWLQSGSYTHVKSFDISHLVAERFDRLCLVRFRLNASGTLGRSADVGGPYVVTDLWAREGDGWMLLRRFLSAPAPPPRPRAPQ